KSETLSNLQLELLIDEEPSATRDEVEAEARREPVNSAPPRERKPHPGRKPLPDTLALRGRSDSVRSVHLHQMRRGNGSNRLRRKGETGGRAGALLRARDQA